MASVALGDRWRRSRCRPARRARTARHRPPQQFFADLGRGDTGGGRPAVSDRPTDAQAALNEAWAGLQATHLDAQILGSRYTEDTGSVNYRFTWQLPKKRTWTYDGVLQHDPRRGQLASPVGRQRPAPQAR